jgi:DNA-binding NarL/FixJ family response regulator
MSDGATRVLVVDDQPPFRDIARQVVNMTPGFEVVGEAETGEDAVRMASELHPDLILMDINLPGISGIEATSQITTAAPSTVVILMSTYAASDLPAEATTCGAARYVHKEDLDPMILLDSLAAGSS